MTRVVMSSKGQIVVPARVRREMDLSKGTQFEVERRGGEIVLTPVEATEWEQCYGMFSDGPSALDELEQDRARERARDQRRADEFDRGAK